MPSALVATVGSASANSYLTVVEADALAGDRLDAAAWTALDPDDKTRALLTATKRLEQLRYWGCRVTEAQALSFPRDRQEDTTEIPAEVKEAQFEEALSAVRGAASGQASIQELQAQGVTAHSVGGFSQTFGAGGVGGTQMTAVSAPARRLLSRWVKATGQVLGPRSGKRDRRWPRA